MLYRPGAVIRNVLLHLCLRLGHMSMHRQIEIMRRLHELRNIVRRASIRRMRRNHRRNPSVRLAMPGPSKCNGFIQLLLLYIGRT
ncbi:hypothetical protein D3C77_560930 [compost metagenome]